MTTTTKPPSVASVIWSQIPIGVKMSLGARQATYPTAGGGLRFQVGPGNPRRYITIELNGADLYDIKCLRPTRRKGELLIATDAERRDVYAEDLGRVLLAIESEVWG